MQLSFENCENPNDPAMCKQGITQSTTFSMSQNVPFNEEGNQTYIKIVLHVPTLPKNLVSVGQIVEQGMQG